MSEKNGIPLTTAGRNIGIQPPHKGYRLGIKTMEGGVFYKNIKKRYLNNNHRITLQKGGPFKDGGEFFFGLKIQDIFHLNFNE